MRLLVFVGAGNPTHSLYNRVYSLLENKAPRYGYTAVDWSIRWPGQGPDPSRSGDNLNLTDAIAVGAKRMQHYENLGDDYHILARSFGALVAAGCAVSFQPAKLKKLILWGPPVYWLMWQKFVRDFEGSRIYNLTKGVCLDEHYFSSLIPFESMLNDLKCPTIIATGSRDSYCSAEYLQYLQSLVKTNKNLIFRIVDDAPHEVTEDLPQSIISDYLTTLFS